MTDSPLTFAVTGASGAPYALHMLRRLMELRQKTDLLVSSSAVMVLKQEVDAARTWMDQGLPSVADFGLDESLVRRFGAKDYMAPVASGTARSRGMIICPCSMGTVGRIAAGVSGNLIERAADVCLKERRRLVIVFREAPLSAIHLRNLLTLTEAGAIVMPAAPGFYHGVQGVESLLDHVAAKAFDLLGIEHRLIRRWGDES